jgi:hypothetical protein
MRPVIARGRCPNALAFAWAAVLTAACVPRDDPPAGRHIVADRASTPVGFVRPNDDGRTRVLLARPGRDPYAVDLWMVSVDAVGGAPVERLLAENVVANFGASQTQVYGHGNCGGADGQGRLLIVTQDESGSPNLARIDAVTGDRLDLGAVESCFLSASAERLLAVQSQSAVLYGPGDAALPLDARSGTFLGEDLYYLTRQQDLLRLSAGSSPELLATKIGSFGPWVAAATGPAVLLARPTADPLATDYSILDVGTAQETPLPFPLNSGFLPSPDGRWWVTFDRDTGRATFIDWTTGNQEPIALAGVGSSQAAWRPGHDEVWFSSFSSLEPSVSIRRPGGFARDLPLSPTGVGDNRGAASIFTADGAFWFSSPLPSGDAPAVLVGSADDPTGPRFPVAPPATVLTAYTLLSDGRILTPTWTSSPERNNLYAVDPKTGETEVLGEASELLAAGQTRLLVNQHVVEHTGDLTVVDLAGGQTVLASEFTAAAVAEPAGADLVAPGALVAFSFVARFPSDYDGVWLATVP